MANLTPTRVDKMSELITEKVDHTKICEILKHTYLCLSPLTKMYLKVIDLLRKSQVGLYMEKGNKGKKSLEIHALTADQIATLDECYSSCLNYQKMDLNKDTFFAYLCTGRIPDATFFSKKNSQKINKKADKKRNKNRKGQLAPPSPLTEKGPESLEDSVDPAKAFLEWKDKTQKMFNVYEHLTGKRSKIEEIIKHVDPARKTCLLTLFKSKECDRCQKVVEDLTENLTKIDITAICTCGCFQSLAETTNPCVPDGEGLCRCEYCGREVDLIEETNKSPASASASSTSLNSAHKNENKAPPPEVTPTLSTEDNPSSSNNDEASSVDPPACDLADPTTENMVDGQMYIRMKGENSASVLDLLSKHSVEWDYSAVKVDYDTMNVSMTKASGMSSDPGFKEKIQSLLANIGSTVGEALGKIAASEQNALNLELSSPQLISKNNKKNKKNKKHRSGSEGSEVTVKASLTVKVPENLKESMEILGLISKAGAGDTAASTPDKDKTPLSPQSSELSTNKDNLLTDELPTPADNPHLISPLPSDTYLDKDNKKDEELLHVVFTTDKSCQTEEQFFESSFSILEDTNKEVEFGPAGLTQKRKIPIKIF